MLAALTQEVQTLGKMTDFHLAEKSDKNENWPCDYLGWFG